MSSTVFSFTTPTEEADTFPIKWNICNSKYEVYHSSLQSFDLSALIPHCLGVKTKVNAVVTSLNHRAISYFRVMPRTVANILRVLWDKLIQDLQGPDYHEDEPTFDLVVRSFIALYATEEDRYDLVQLLRNPAQKPKQLSVQSFNYKLQELNEFVEWMPGQEPKLTDLQLRQGLHNVMPNMWKQRFSDADSTVSSNTSTQLVRYFRVQEKLLIASKMAQNEHTNKQFKSRKGREENKKVAKNYAKKNSKFKKTNDAKPASRRIADDAPCPIHPDLSTPHTWGQCNLNA